MFETNSIPKQEQEAEAQREFLARSDEVVDLTISGSKDSLHCGNETIMIANATHLVENIDLRFRMTITKDDDQQNNCHSFMLEVHNNRH